MAKLKKYVYERAKQIGPKMVEAYEKAAAYVACFKTHKEAIELVKKETGKKVMYEKLIAFMKIKRGKNIVAKVRERYLRNISEVPIANKRVRLDRIEEEYSKAKDVKDRIKLLEQARKEIEGESGDIFFQINQFHGISDAELEERRKKIMERLKKEVIDIEGKGRVSEGGS